MDKYKVWITQGQGSGQFPELECDSSQFYSIISL